MEVSNWFAFAGWHGFWVLFKESNACEANIDSKSDKLEDKANNSN